MATYGTSYGNVESQPSYRSAASSANPGYNGASYRNEIVTPFNPQRSMPKPKPIVVLLMIIVLSTSLLMVTGFALQINATAPAGQPTFLIIDAPTVRFGAFFFVFTWLTCAVAFFLKRTALLLISAGMICCIPSFVIPFQTLRNYRQISTSRCFGVYCDDIDDFKKLLAGCIISYVGVMSMFIASVFYCQSVIAGARGFLASIKIFPALITMATFVSLLIGTSCILSSADDISSTIDLTATYLFIAFVFFVGFLSQAKVLTDAAALLSAASTIGSIQFLLSIQDDLDQPKKVKAGFVFLWLTSVLMIVYYYLSVMETPLHLSDAPCVEKQPLLAPSSDQQPQQPQQPPVQPSQQQYQPTYATQQPSYAAPQPPYAVPQPIYGVAPPAAQPPTQYGYDDMSG